MMKGLKTTLLAGALGLAIAPSAFAAAPVISDMPDITVGDVSLENPSGSNNVFVFSNAFSFSDYVSDSDTPDAQLIWSFGEFDSDSGLTTPQYSINGKAPVNAGDAAIAADQIAGHPAAKAPGANRINDTDFATFRDVLFSPGTGSGPFPAPTPTQAAQALVGKGLRFYVADAEGGLDYEDVLIRTVDNGANGLSVSEGFQEEFTDTNFTSGWKKSGIDSGPEYAFDTSSPDDVDVTSATAGQLDVIVRPSTGRTRILGWFHDSVMTYNEVGNGKFVRGKFHIYTSNAALAPVNEVPNFRVRLQNDGAVVAAVNISHAQTGSGGTPHEPRYDLFNNAPGELITGDALRPSSLPTSPSVYKVDFDPIDVPAAAGTNIWATFESFATSNFANATLSLTELVVGTYAALAPEDGVRTLLYDKTVGAAAGSVNFAGGGFNYEADFQAGRRQALFYNGDGKGTLPSQLPTATQAVNQGILVDTIQTPVNVFSAGTFRLVDQVMSDRARVEAGKLYMARFYVTSSIPTSGANATAVRQGSVNLNISTAGGAVQSVLAISGSNASGATGPTPDIAGQALPGLGSQNPQTSATIDATVAGEDGGWYSVLLASPLDAGAIRADDENFGLFAAQPGAGNVLPSARDIEIGGVVLKTPDTLRLSPTFVTPYTEPNRGLIRVSFAELLEYDAIDDSGLGL
jgi:hypothetical protein